MGKNSNLKKIIENEMPKHKFKWYEYIPPLIPGYGFYYMIKNNVDKYNEKYYDDKGMPNSVLKYVRKKVNYNLIISLISLFSFVTGVGVHYSNIERKEEIKQEIIKYKESIQSEKNYFKNKFKELDLNNSGVIEPNELIKKYDLNNDKVLNFNEFIKMPENKSHLNDLKSYESSLKNLQ